MISVKPNTAKVKRAAKTPTARLPAYSPTLAPHHADPTVCVIVLTVRMAAIGSSTFLRS